MVNHYIPSSLKEALEIISETNCYLLAGGTDLMVMKRRSSGLLPNFDKDVCFIGNLKELQYIIQDDMDNIHIGAGTKYVDILANEKVPQLMKDIIREIASPNIRNMATLAGNIGNASPAGDALVGLYLLDAKVVLLSIYGKREMPVSEYILGVRKTARKNDELIKEIVIPPYEGKTYWKKVGSRAAESISKCTFAGAYQIENGIVKDLRMAFGSVSVTVVRNKEIEDEFKNIKIEDLQAKKAQIIEKISKFITPITDQRSTKDYRYKVELNILGKFLENIK